MDYGPVAKKIAVSHAKQLAKELVTLVAVPAIEEAVSKSETKFDDLAVEALKQPIVDALIKAIDSIKEE